MADYKVSQWGRFKPNLNLISGNGVSLLYLDRGLVLKQRCLMAKGRPKISETSKPGI